MTAQSKAPTDPPHSTLNSWKEIAAYFDRGVRTVQRWERDLQLPVHRIGKGKRSPVFAVVAELKFWLLTAASVCAVRDRDKMPRDSDAHKHEVELTARFKELAQTFAETSVRHRRQAETLEKNILALRSRLSPRKTK